MRTQPQEVIAKLESDNSRLAKEAVIQSAMEEGLDEFFVGLRMALDPLVTFGVKQVPERSDVLTGQGLSWNNFETLANQLVSRELTGHAARDAIELAMGVATTEQWNMFRTYASHVRAKWSAVRIRPVRAGGRTVLAQFQVRP